MVRLLTLGAADVLGVIHPISAGRPLAALVFLSLHSKGVPRSQLVDILWDPGVVRAERHSLSQLLYALKRCLPPNVLVTSGATGVTLAASLVSDDYTDFMRAFRTKDYATAASMYRGSFLAGLPIISESFEEWRAECAAAAESAAVQAYRILVEQKLACEDNAAIPDLCSRALQIARHDPFFTRAQIEALAAQNDVGAALSAYATYRRLIIRETGAVPPWMTEEFAARISGLSHVDLAADRNEVAIPFVGRAGQLKALRDAWRCSQHKLSALRLIGEAGAGKSRLLTQFVRRTVLEGARVHLHKCAEAESLIPYAAIVGLLLSNCRRDVVSGMSSQLRGALASIAPEIDTDDGTGHYHQRVIFEAFAQYFCTVAQHQRLVLAIDDFQWSDDVSRSALSHVIRRLEQYSCLVLLAMRPERCDSTMDDVFGELPLEPMTPNEVDKLIDHHEALRAVAISRRDRATIHARSAGNPFFVLQLLRYLGDNPSTDVASGVEVLLPARVSRLLKSRLIRLSDTARHVAAAAAVLNRPAPVSAVAEVSGLSEIVVAHAMNELVQSGILQDGQNCQFVHDLMRQSAYEDASVPLQQVLHHRTARALVIASASPGELAYHFEQAGLMREAWSYARVAAQEATRLSAYREADAQYQRMQRCVGNDRSNQTQAEYLSFLYHSNRLVDAYSHVDAVELYATESSDPQLQVLCRLARAVREGLSPEGARQLIDDAQRSCPAELPKVIRYVFEVVRGNGGPNVLEAVGRMLREEMRGTAGAHRHATAGLIIGITDGYDDALPVVEQAVLLAEQSTDPAALASALFARAVVRSWAGMCNLALDDYNRVLTLSDETGAVDFYVATACNLAVLNMEQDKLDAAEIWARQALRTEMAAQRPFVLGNLALISYRRGDYLAARKYIDMLESSPTRDFQQWIAVQALVLRGLCRVGENAWTEALEVERELAAFTNIEALPIDLATLHEFVGQVMAVRDGPAKAECYLLEKSTKTVKFDYLAGARLVLLATTYFQSSKSTRVESIAAPILERATKSGATAVAKEAAAVLELFGSSRRRTNERQQAGLGGQIKPRT